MDDSDEYLEDLSDLGIGWLTGLAEEKEGLQAHHLTALRQRLLPTTVAMYPDPTDAGAALAIIPLPDPLRRGSRALMGVIDNSSSKNERSNDPTGSTRIENSHKAIAAVAAEYSTGGVFILPWDTRVGALTQIQHASDEDEVLAQLTRMSPPHG